MCFECAFEERGNGHKITKMEDVDPETIGDQNKTLAELKEVVEKGKELLKSLNDELTEIDKNKDEIVKKIEETVNALRKELDRIETQHKQKLEEEITTTKDLIIARSGELKETIESVEGFIKGVETNASSDDLYTKLWNISGLSSAKEKLNALETDKLENVRFSYTADIEAEKEKLKSLVDSFRSDKRVISLGTKSGFVPVSFDKLATTQNATAEIPTGQNTTHDGGAIFDAEKRVIVATSGNYDSGKSLKVTKLGSNPDDVRGETRLIANIIPFGTHGSYPVYDGTKWVYFFESESGSNNRFGRLDIDNLDARDFKELPRIPSGSFIEFSSAVHHFGNIYALGDSYKIWRFVVSVRFFIHSHFLKLLHNFAAYRKTDGKHCQSSYQTRHAFCQMVYVRTSSMHLSMVSQISTR